MSKSPATLISVLLTVLVLPTHVQSYESDTHSDISGKAYELARLDDFLAEQLGVFGTQRLARGSFLFQPRLTPLRWLQEGSKDEDEPIRYVNHFYDPIYNRGLTAGILRRERSYEWGL